MSPQFNPVEAQQHIAEARKAATAVYVAVEEPVARDLNRILTGLASDLESAVEYIAGLEKRFTATTEHYSGLLEQDDSRVAALEDEVARLNGVIARVKAIEPFCFADPDDPERTPGDPVVWHCEVLAALAPAPTEPTPDTDICPECGHHRLTTGDGAMSHADWVKFNQWLADGKPATEPEKEN